MNEAPSANEAPASEHLQEADKAHTEALKTLGEVAAAPKQYSVDEYGVVTTPREQQRELQFRQTHGHASNETHTRV
jgi:hypothetical protein